MNNASRFFDPQKKQLIYMQSTADAEYWDSHWNLGGDLRKDVLRHKDTFVSSVTQKYLQPSEGELLEGGCGPGYTVASLVNHGYRVIGVDFAKGSVDLLRQYVPELDIRFDDVRNLSFGNDSFSGYWSVGVIEHFWEGYEEILSEMYRVIRPGGYLFLTFPCMSLLRNIKSYIGLYPKWESGISKKNFYQFALNSNHVINDVEAVGFTLVRKTCFEGQKGLSDEIPFFREPMNRLYGYKGRNILLRIVRRVFNEFISVFAGHSILLVFQKKISK